MYIFRRRRINVCNVSPCPNRFIARLYPKWPPAWPLWPFAHNPTYSEGRSLYCATSCSKHSNIATLSHPVKTQSNPSHKTLRPLKVFGFLVLVRHLWKFSDKKKKRDAVNNLAYGRFGPKPPNPLTPASADDKGDLFKSE